MTRFSWTAALLSLPLLVACPDVDDTVGDDDAGEGESDDDGDSSASDSDGGTSDSQSDETEDEPVCSDASEVPCEDDSILLLDLKENVAPGLIYESHDDSTGVFSAHVDATAGGAFSITDSYVYAAFTDDGLEKVLVSDEDAFTSMDWDIAFRRYVVRLNSGVSGPSCVTGARTAPGTVFDELDEIPEDLIYRTEAYMTDTCELVSDGSGLGSSPGVALASYYAYDSCVQMTGNVFVIELASGRHLKLEMTAYYYEADQADCNAGTADHPGGSGNLRLKWAFLD